MDVDVAVNEVQMDQMGRNGGRDTKRRHHNDMEVGKWRSLSRKVEGTTRSLALPAQWLQLPLGPQEACSVQALGLPSSVPTLNNYSLGLVATVMFIAALSPAIPSPTGAFIWSRPICSPHVPGRWVFLTWKLGYAFRSGIHLLPRLTSPCLISAPRIYFRTAPSDTRQCWPEFLLRFRTPEAKPSCHCFNPSSDDRDIDVCFGRMWETVLESEH